MFFNVYIELQFSLSGANSTKVNKNMSEQFSKNYLHFWIARTVIGITTGKM